MSLCPAWETLCRKLPSSLMSFKCENDIIIIKSNFFIFPPKKTGLNLRNQEPRIGQMRKYVRKRSTVSKANLSTKVHVKDLENIQRVEGSASHKTHVTTDNFFFFWEGRPLLSVRSTRSSQKSITRDTQCARLFAVELLSNTQSPDPKLEHTRDECSRITRFDAVLFQRSKFQTAACLSFPHHFRPGQHKKKRK